MTTHPAYREIIQMNRFIGVVDVIEGAQGTPATSRALWWDKIKLPSMEPLQVIPKGKSCNRSIEKRSRVDEGGPFKKRKCEENTMTIPER
jgi:hypothetical protein